MRQVRDSREGATWPCGGRRIQAGREQQKEEPSGRRVLSVPGTPWGKRSWCWVTGWTLHDLKGQRERLWLLLLRSHVRNRAALSL